MQPSRDFVKLSYVPTRSDHVPIRSAWPWTYGELTPGMVMWVYMGPKWVHIMDSLTIWQRSILGPGPLRAYMDSSTPALEHFGSNSLTTGIVPLPLCGPRGYIMDPRGDYTRLHDDMTPCQRVHEIRTPCQRAQRKNNR